MTVEKLDPIATIAQHRAAAASLRLQAEAIDDDAPQRAYLETAALAYEAIARQLSFLAPGRTKSISSP